jgi:hypothetical protein
MANDMKPRRQPTPYAAKSVAACKKHFAKSVAACIIKASAHWYDTPNEIKHDAEEKADQHVAKSVAACKKLSAKSVAAFIIKASAHCYDICNKHCMPYGKIPPPDVHSEAGIVAKETPCQNSSSEM